jgi:trimethylamine:corrinoid methyltransferase-like protein
MLGALTGINMISGAGMLESLACHSVEKLVMDAESIASAYRLVRGIEAPADTLARGMFAQIGLSGEFLKLKETRTMFRREQHIPSAVIDRGTEASGDAFARARAREAHKGDTDAVYSRFQKDVLKTKGTKAIEEAIAATTDELTRIEANPQAKPLKIGIIGEIYTIIEPYTNLNIEQKLGAMGVEADRSMTASMWIKDKIFHRTIGGYAEADIYESAKPYIDRCIGGHTQECIGHAIRYAKAGYDGAIEVLEDAGMIVAHPWALRLLQEAGCRVDHDTQRVRFPRDLVQWSIDQCPEKHRAQEQGELAGALDNGIGGLQVVFVH